MQLSAFKEGGRHAAPPCTGLTPRKEKAIILRSNLVLTAVNRCESSVTLLELLTNPIKLWLLLTDEVVGTVALIQLSDSEGPWHSFRNV